MSHSPVQYKISVADPAHLATYPASFDAGDVAFVTSLGYSFTYNPASTAVVDNVSVINGPGGVGRWLIALDGALSISPTAVTLQGGRSLISPRTPVGAGPHTVGANEGLIAKTAIAAGGDAVTLPDALKDGRAIAVKDESQSASTNPIIVVPASGTIDGGAALVLSANGAAAEV